MKYSRDAIALPNNHKAMCGIQHGRDFTFKPVLSKIMVPSERNLAYFNGERYRFTTLGPFFISNRFISTNIAECEEPTTQTVSCAVTNPVQTDQTTIRTVQDLVSDAACAMSVCLARLLMPPLRTE